MANDLLQIGEAQAYWNVSRTKVLKYTVEMFHKGLNDHKIISAPDVSMLQNKANLQAKKWADIWDSIETRRKNSDMKEASIEKAFSLTQEAESAVAAMDNLLFQTLNINDAVDWEKLKKYDNFSKKMPPEPSIKNTIEYPKKPASLVVTFTFFEKLFKSKKEQKLKTSKQRYQGLLEDWIAEKIVIDKKNDQHAREYETKIVNWKGDVQLWNQNEKEFLSEREKYNQNIDLMKASYFERNQNSVVEYCDMVLNNSEYPLNFPKSFEIEYVASTKILIVEYQLPSLNNLPMVKEVKYISTRKELKETQISESQLTKMFDEVIYKIALRTAHELFEADVADALDAVSFNGWVKATNKATGKEENNCILSFQVKKIEFIELDLANVEPKVCFKNLKGVASSKLSSITPIQPILQISKVDKRFVESYEVASSMDTSTNLAAMDWADFEHLIREIFEKEFQVNGGEVKITQASRDGGVDAIAFDPDPIRGGKIVIQAKRYTNTVGVSAVRDLYGTTMNEGATKGILVSTADYGPDAYEFAKGKPITLLNGGNLLHLLQKHGYHAKIDLREAKKILAEREL